ncbi:MAG: SurA N-terminal domain-containing protein [Candidatus Competibacter sp.]
MLLQKIRDHAKGWFAYTIIAMLIVPFAVWGINYYFEGGGPMDAAVVGDSKITLQEFQRAYQQQRQRMQAMLGGNMDPALFEGPQMKQDVLRQLVDERVLDQIAREQGLRIGDPQLHAAIISLPVFQQSGGFTQELYQRLLQNQGFSTASFEEGLRQSLATQQLRDGVVESTVVTPAELDQLAALLKQQRDLHYVVLPLEKALARVSVDEEAIKTHFEKNKERFVNPERAQLQFVELQLAKIAEGIAVGDAELKASYEEQLVKYGRPEERKASHILVKLAANASEADIEQARVKAQQIADSLRAGARSFDQAAAEAKADASGQLESGDLGVIGKGMFDDPALENALFALKEPGEVSGVVRMPAGFQLIRLDGVIPAQVKPFEDVREQVAKDLRQQQAENRFYEITQNLANLAYEHPDSLETAAKNLDLPIQESAWFSRAGGEGIAANPKVIASAFSEDVIKRGLNSEPIELDSGHVVVIRSKGYQEATPRTLEESREDIVKSLRDTKAREALSQVVESVKARVAQGAHLQSLAGEFEGTYHHPGLVERDAATSDRAVLTAAFRLPQPEPGKMALGSTPLANGDQAVLAVTRVVPGGKEAFSEDERKTLSQQLAQQAGGSQFNGLLESVRNKVKVVSHIDRL